MQTSSTTFRSDGRQRQAPRRGRVPAEPDYVLAHRRPDAVERADATLP